MPSRSPPERVYSRGCGYFRLFFAYYGRVFDPDANIPRPNRSLIYFGACIIAGVRLARESQVSTRVVPTIKAIEESCDLAHDIYNRVFRKMPGAMKKIT